jgi:glycosyltransferase involved in cell wall biosynthesis
MLLNQLNASKNLFRSQAPKRVALVHEWLVAYAGSEHVLHEILALFPDADLFAVVDFLSDEDRAKLSGKRAKTTFIQRLPFASRRYRNYLPLMPIAIEQLDLSSYDVIISSSHAVAKGVLTGPDQLHICYCHTPIRYAWDLQHQYLREARLAHGIKSLFARLILHYIRLWDARTVNGVDQFIANSDYVARRIKKVYRRDAKVIHPPVDLEMFTMHAVKEDYYLAASRLVPYKRIDLIVEAFSSTPDRKLVVIGDGPEMPRIRRLAGPNVSFLGYQKTGVLKDYLQRARAFVFAAEEDFGIIPLEAQACGTPVIAFGRGGALETVVAQSETPTGVFFYSQTVPSLLDAIRHFETLSIKPETCRKWAESFSATTFRDALRREFNILDANELNVSS